MGDSSPPNGRVQHTKVGAKRVGDESRGGRIGEDIMAVDIVGRCHTRNRALLSRRRGEDWECGNANVYDGYGYGI